MASWRRLYTPGLLYYEPTSDEVSVYRPGNDQLAAVQRVGRPARQLYRRYRMALSSPIECSASGKAIEGLRSIRRANTSVSILSPGWLSRCEAIPIRQITIFSADRLHAAILQRMAGAVFSGAEIQPLHLMADVLSGAHDKPPELLIAGVNLSGGDAIDLLTRFMASCSGARVFVVTGLKEIRPLAALRALPIVGIFDPMTDTPAQFEFALREIVAGHGYWSASVLDRLYPSSASELMVCRGLTLTEQIVLSVIGGGCDDISAAVELGLKASTIQSVRKQLHRKLDAQHKGDLISRAAQYGFVQFTHEGVERPGFSSLLAKWRNRRAAPSLLPPGGSI